MPTSPQPPQPPPPPLAAPPAAQAESPQPTVREMRLSEVGLRINYFHDSSDEHLARLGVDRARLPSRAEWQAFYDADYARR